MQKLLLVSFRFRQSGFTLIELLIGMALASLLMAVLVSFLSVSLKMWHFGSIQSTLQQTSRISLDTMVRELRFAKTIQFPSNDGTVNAITFTNFRNEVVTYTCGTSSGANPQTLYRRVFLTDNPLTENKVAALSFTVIKPRTVFVVLTITDTNSGQSETLQTAVTCLNVH